MSIEYSYSDGSGNTYVIRSEKSKTIEYKPVKRRYSSSGLYNGGAPTLKKLNDPQYEQVIEAINKAINNKECHIENRVKTSGMITKEHNKVKQIIIINSKSKELKTIEKLLKQIIKN